MNCRKMLAAVAATVIFLSGCGSKGMDNAEIESLLTQARETMETVESMEAEMTMEMDMGMNGESIETTTKAKIRSQQDPLKMAMEMAVVMSDGTEADHMQMYAVEEDGHLRTYMATADTWYEETLELGELNQYNAEANMDLYLKNIKNYKSGGVEEINGKKATKISGVITGDAMEEVVAGSGLTASAESLGISEEMLASIYAELGDLPVSLWVDAEGYVLKYELDMTGMMQKIMNESMKAMGASEEDLLVKIKKTTITMVCSEFNAVDEIVIPKTAVEHLHEE